MRLLKGKAKKAFFFAPAQSYICLLAMSVFWMVGGYLGIIYQMQLSLPTNTPIRSEERISATISFICNSSLGSLSLLKHFIYMYGSAMVIQQTPISVFCHFLDFKYLQYSFRGPKLIRQDFLPDVEMEENFFILEN